MAKRFYEIGLMVQASPAEYDFETVEWEDDFDRVADARKRAKEQILIIETYTAFWPVKEKRRAVINGNMRYDC